MYKRIKQCVVGIFYTIKPFTDKDKVIINTYLDSEELRLFNTMKKYDRSHCIRVTKGILSYLQHNKIVLKDKNELIKAALIHDIGKREGNFYILNRVVIILLDKIFKDKKLLLKNKKFYIYKNHAKIGYDILKKNKGFSEEALYIVKNHHEKSLDKLKEEIVLLQTYDDKN